MARINLSGKGRYLYGMFKCNASIPHMRQVVSGEVIWLLTYFIATPPDRGWQRNEGVLLLHSFLSLDILVAFSILRFGTSAKSVS